MMNIETHLETLREVFAALDLCIEKGAENHQRTIGFHTSLGAAEMFEMLLHKKMLLSLSARSNHTWMRSQKRLREKIRFEFPRKEEILELLYLIEKNRDDLCYGKRVEIARIEEQLSLFQRLRVIMREVGLDEI
jgi:hypothetical protein